MERLRTYYDADRAGQAAIPTTFQTGNNKNEIFCSLCGGTVFVNDLIFEDVKRVIENTLENPFMCEDCLTEYDELAHQV